MPTYDYRCPKGHVFEVFQRFSDPDPEGCEVCGAGPLERLLYAPAVHFKGSGFYATDYGRGAKKRAEKDGDGAGKDEKKSEKAEKASSEKSSSSTSSGSD